MGAKKQLEKEIREAYIFLRENNMSIPSETLQFMLYASLEKLGDLREPYDRHFGDNRECECGHPYHRHFDAYENWEHVGCKYCGCNEFKDKL